VVTVSAKLNGLWGRARTDARELVAQRVYARASASGGAARAAADVQR